MNFPEFMFNEKNKIPASQQNTRGPYMLLVVSE